MAKVLLACEESQAVCKEFRRLGHQAYSCDILPCSGGHSEWHYHGDIDLVLPWSWDLIIAFPPCTHLAVSGARYFEQKKKDGRQQQGIDFFMKFANYPCERIAIENPVGIMSTVWRKPDQIVQPYFFGDPFQKKTCLWLKNLPLLQPTHIVEPGEQAPYGTSNTMPKWISNATGNRAVLRSKTFPGIAKAMAEQWSIIL